MMIIYVILLAALAVGTCVLLLLIVRARNRRRFFSASRGIACEAPGSIGISVLCSGVHALEQVENLLSVEYPRYEVIVVLDSRRYSADFQALVSRYRMIGVEYTPADELPVHGVRSMGRSRRRSYRRLVLIDREFDTPFGDFDAAVGVAAHDFVLTVSENQYLLRDAIERLVTEVGFVRSEPLIAVRSWVGEPMTLLSREAVVFAGGFAQRPIQYVPRCGRTNLWEPFFRAPRQERCSGHGQVVGMVLLTLGLAGSVFAQWWALTALLVTVTLVWVAVRCALLALEDVAGPCLGGVVAWRRHLQKLCVKNFTMS